RGQHTPAHTAPPPVGDGRQHHRLGVGEMVVDGELAVDAGAHGGHQPDRGAVADDDDAAVERGVVEEAHPQPVQHRHVAVQDVVPALPAGHGQVQVAVVPAPVDRVELVVGGLVGAVLELTDLDL